MNSLRHWKKILVVCLALVIGTGALFHKNVNRLWIAITLYDEDKIVNNFMSLYQSFNASTIAASDTPFELPEVAGQLPDSFTLDGGGDLDLQDFLRQSGTTGLLVIKNGEIRVEDYYLGNSREQQHISWSMGKSFLSAMFGLAIEEGHIKSIEETVTDYVPELIGTGYDKVRIKDVLQMSSGVRFNEDYGDFHSDINRFGRTIALGSSLDNFSASLERQRTPGTYNHYVSIDTQVLGMVLDRALDVSLSQYLSDKFWQPMGMEYPAYWLTDDYGMELALGGLNVTLRDYAKFGWLFLNKGKWGEQQLVPEQWVKDSVTPDAPHLMPGINNPQSSSVFGYGYQWWIPVGADDEFLAQGIYNQYIYIDPDQQLVIVKLSANHRYNDKSQQWSQKHLAMFRAISQFYHSGDRGQPAVATLAALPR